MSNLIQNSVVCLEGILLCPTAFLGLFFLDFFSIISFTFSLASSSIFLSINFFFNFFHLKCSKWPISQNIWCLIKIQLTNITQTIFQGYSPWATLIYNSVVCFRVHYCVQLLPEVMFFLIFSIIFFTFSFAS